MSEPIKLSPAVINLGKNRSGQKSRSGYVNENGQVYLPPVSDKRAGSWRKKMEEKGHVFNG